MLSTPSRPEPSSCSLSLTLPGVFVVHSLDDFHHLCADIFGVEHFHIVSVAADLLIEIVGGVQAVAEDGIAVLGRDLVSPFGIYVQTHSMKHYLSVKVDGSSKGVNT